jgi:hypothetical protein
MALQLIPQATDDPADSQAQLLQNFTDINSDYGIAADADHVEFAASSNNGKHKRTTLISSATAPVNGGTDQVIIYSQTKATAQTMPYYKRDNLATEYPLSPIKAYAVFNLTNTNVAGTIAIVPTDSFNCSISQVTTVVSGILVDVTIEVTITNACRTSNYGVFPSCSTTNGTISNSDEYQSLVQYYQKTSTSLMKLFLTRQILNSFRTTNEISFFIMET